MSVGQPNVFEFRRSDMESGCKVGSLASYHPDDTPRQLFWLRNLHSLPCDSKVLLCIPSGIIMRCEHQKTSGSARSA